MIFFALFVLGLILGSFVNALTWRLHEQDELADKKVKAGAARRRELSVLRGRSMCAKCGHRLSAKDLVPLLSWIVLRGKCRYCHKPISVSYPLVELVTAAAFALSYAWWPLGFSDAYGIVSFVVWLIVVVGLSALALYDARWQLLPDKLVFPLAGLALAWRIYGLATGHGGFSVVGILLTLAITSGVFLAVYYVSRGKWIGFGDVTLGVLTGLLLASPLKGFLYLFLASLLGTVWAIPQLLLNKLGIKSKLPYGPFLIAACFVVFLLVPDGFLDWYLGLFIR